MKTKKNLKFFNQWSKWWPHCIIHSIYLILSILQNVKPKLNIEKQIIFSNFILKQIIKILKTWEGMKHEN